MNNVTQLLNEAGKGNDPKAQNALLEAVYHELRIIAHAKMVKEKPGHTLQATILVNDAWLKLFPDGKGSTFENRAHFFGTAARVGDLPFFAMKYVDGLPITKYADKYNLSVPVRLNLYLQVCKAIEHAHEQEIIHRDIKPSNILVTEKRRRIPQVKVIDFGIAKILNNGLPLAFATRTGQSLGTPAYMSPEQTGEDPDIVDESCDIYALGVLLYELLTGQLPLNVQGEEAKQKQIIRECKPLPPSACIRLEDNSTNSKTARQRGMDRNRLEQVLKGELDRITLKCLEKKKEDRYQTVNCLATDISNYLKSPPPTEKEKVIQLPTPKSESWTRPPEVQPSFKVESLHSEPASGNQYWPVFNADSSDVSQTLYPKSINSATRLFDKLETFYHLYKSIINISLIIAFLIIASIYLVLPSKRVTQEDAARTEAKHTVSDLNLLFVRDDLASDENLEKDDVLVKEDNENLHKLDVSAGSTVFRTNWNNFLNAFSKFSQAMESRPPKNVIWPNTDRNNWLIKVGELRTDCVNANAVLQTS